MFEEIRLQSRPGWIRFAHDKTFDLWSAYYQNSIRMVESVHLGGHVRYVW